MARKRIDLTQLSYGGSEPGSTAVGYPAGWHSDDVALSRICIGVHDRLSVDAGVAMGTKIGELAAQRLGQGLVAEFAPLAVGTSSGGR